MCTPATMKAASAGMIRQAGGRAIAPVRMSGAAVRLRIAKSTAAGAVASEQARVKNLEYHIAVSGPFRIVFCGDAGGVFDEGQSPDFGLLRYSDPEFTEVLNLALRP